MVTKTVNSRHTLLFFVYFCKPPRRAFSSVLSKNRRLPIIVIAILLQ